MDTYPVAYWSICRPCTGVELDINSRGGGCTFIVFVGIQIYIVNSIDDKGLQNFPGCGYTQSSQRSSALALPDGAISFSSTN
jgi:hypothetical protein